MKANLRNPFFVAIALMLLLAAMFFLFPIDVFEGQVVYSNGVEKITLEHQRLSLSYFLGIGLGDGKSLDDISSMSLYAKDTMLAILMIAGFPALLGYRVWIANQNRKQKES